jgi:hypothetical protein
MNRARALALAFPLAVGWGVPACGLNQEGVEPPKNTFFYPASAVLGSDPSQSWLFVANSNADLRYNDGTLVMVNVGGDAAGVDVAGKAVSLYGAEADRTSRAADWGPCPMGDYVKTPRTTSIAAEDQHFCCRDHLDPNILNCDERAYIPADNSVRIGSFAAGMVLQTPGCNADMGLHRLFVAVRGNTSLTYLNVTEATPPEFQCLGTAVDPQTGTFAECNEEHRIVQAKPTLGATGAMAPDVPLPNEPYALAIDPNNDLLYLGHLTGDTAHAYSGGFSLFDVAPKGNVLPMPLSISPFPSPFPANSNGLFGVTSLNWEPVRGGGEIIATSRYQPMVTGLAATVVPGCMQGDRGIAAFPNGDSYSSPLAGAETRGIEFIGDNAFVLQRTPPALIEFDANHVPIAVLETCSSPTFLYKTSSGGVDRLLVNCFDVGEMYVFDPAVPHLESTLQIGRGPAGLVIGHAPVGGNPLAYVVGFGDNNISVIDLDPTSATRYHVIQRIGFPSTVPR